MKEEEKLPFVLTPLNRWCVIHEKEIEARTKSGIILPGTSKTNSAAATIMAVASDCTNKALVPGALVLINHQSGYPFTSEGVQYKLVMELDIMGFYDATRVQAKIDEKQETTK